MKLSIIIVSYNTKKLTLSCIESVRRYSPGFEYELIVIDNGSSDGSSRVLAEMSSKEENFRVILNSENLGFARANNQGIKASTGEYVLLLNSDTEVEEGSIDKLVKYADKNSVGAVVPKLINQDGSIQPSVFHEPTIFRALLQYWLGIGHYIDKYAPGTDTPVEVEVAVMAAFLVTPRALEEVGMLDERFFMYFEDFDYCRRLREKGLPIYYLPDVKVVHLHGESGKLIAKEDVQWRRLTPSSKIYHGWFKHQVLSFILWTGQLPKRLFKKT